MAGAETGIPGSRLQPGERFSEEFALVEKELSRRAGGIRKAVPTSMRNEWTKLRKYNKVTGGAKELKLEMSIPLINRDENGNIVKRTVDSWFYNEEWIFNNEWRREKSRAIMYSRSNRNSNGNYFNTGKSGNVIQEGDGIKAQMEHGNVHFYNDFNENFSLKGLESALYDICEQGVDLKDRKFVITTGNRGMIQVHKAIEKETQGWTKILMDNSSIGAVRKTSNAVHQNALTAGYQFTELQAPNGLIMNFVYDPSYDDRERNKIEGPNGQGVLNSYRYDIFDMGTSSNPNMYICKLAGEDDIFRYIIGMRNPSTASHVVIVAKAA
jgi:hypothetical protein